MQPSREGGKTQLSVISGICRSMLQVAKALTDVGVSTVTETALLTNGKSIKVDDISPGDIVAVRAGDQVPVDGEVIRGSGKLRDHSVCPTHIPHYY